MSYRRIGIDEYGYGDWNGMTLSEEQAALDEQCTMACKRCKRWGDARADACLDYTGKCAYCFAGFELGDDELMTLAMRAGPEGMSVVEYLEEVGPIGWGPMGYKPERYK